MGMVSSSKLQMENSAVDICPEEPIIKIEAPIKDKD
jgi:hypothetical protein